MVEFYQRTVLDELVADVILLVHEPQVERSTVTNLIVDIVQASCEQDIHAALDLGIFLADTKFGESSDGGGSDDGIFKDDSVVDVADILGRLRRLGSFETKEVKNAHSKLGEFAILDELAKVGKSLLFGVRHELNKVKHALDNRTLELIAALVTQDAGEERQHASLLARELEAQCADGLHDGDLEFVSDLRHEARDLLHQAINASLVASLEQGGDGKSGDGAIAVGDESLDIGIADIDSLGLERGEVVQDA